MTDGIAKAPSENISGLLKFIWNSTESPNYGYQQQRKETFSHHVYAKLNGF